jgi:hypothetical protein
MHLGGGGGFQCVYSQLYLWKRERIHFFKFVGISGEIIEKLMPLFFWGSIMLLAEVPRKYIVFFCFLLTTHHHKLSIGESWMWDFIFWCVFISQDQKWKKQKNEKEKLTKQDEWMWQCVLLTWKIWFWRLQRIATNSPYFNSRFKQVAKNMKEVVFKWLSYKIYS